MRFKWSQLVAQTILLSLFVAMFFSQVDAHGGNVESDLKEARDALLKQRSDLESLIDRKAGQVSNLQSEIDRLRVYLKDTDNALSNVDSALKGR